MLSDYMKTVALLALVNLVLIILGSVARVNHSGLKRALDLLEPLADEGVRAHAGSASLLQLLGLTFEGLAHLLTQESKWLLVIREPVVSQGRGKRQQK